MHRYKAKTTQLCSPCTSKRFNTPEASALVHNVLPGPSSSVTSSTVTTKSEDSSTTVSNTTSDAGQTTPKSARKWRKSKGTKHSSSNSSSKYDRSSIASTSALGQKISDCPTSGEGDLVPLLVQRCVQCVEAHGMETVGIYRIPGNTAAVNALKESLSHGIENVDCSDARWKDVNVVSSLLKMFLRKLPEPLLTDKLYPIFIDANRISNHRQRLHKLRNLLRKLPPAHYATLKYLIRHLREVVQHSDVNKMETRNMALMFGPSIVRPSDDNMATMVTHMSDQCKIIETFITYYDWVFNDAGTTDDDVPPAVPSACDASASNCGQNSNTLSSGIESDLSVSQGGMMTASFNDMHNLIRKVNEAEATAMMDAQKGGKIKQILNVRRNSRRDRSKKRERERERDHSANPLTSSTCSSAVINQHESAVPTPTSITSTVEHAFCGRYQERDIDAEIASRCQKTVTSASGITNSSMDNSPSVDSSLGSMVDSNYQNSSRTNGALVEGAAHDADEGEEQKYDVDAMRRRRQQTISSARRMFIVGSNVDPNNEAECHHADLDDLVSHTRHLNVAASPALDVLSAETREKIRRIQQLQGWQTTATERHATSAATNVNTDTSTLTKAKEIIGKLVDDDKIKAPTIRTTAEEFSSTDALSLTSDYSTTSSAPLTVPVTVTCLDSLAATSSDYASSDVSPCTYNTNSVSPGTTENMIEISELQSSPRLIGKEFRPSKMPAIFGANSTILTTGSIKLNARLHGNARNERRHSQIEPTKESKSLLIFSLAEEDSSSSSSRSSGQETHKGLKAIKLRSRGSIKRDSWRRHTLSDVDIIRQAIAQDAARESAQKNANHEERSSKVSKLARWIKQNLRRSSMDVQKNTTDKGSAVSTAPTLTQSSVSSETRTPLSEVFPSSGDEQL
ncbi:hypothetical protein AB6A40_003912 [Gnathostoma spinigerum]|uniref:Rho-GAP domain-containing protein n=1 Tax=Gnathostoma spinigerum TaxID=75299 RepID=A0ABD6EJQ3_9BILA